jgi:Glycerol dehydrogenase and related enzymes
MNPIPIPRLTDAEQHLLDRALQSARDTQVLVVEPGIRHHVAEHFQRSCPGKQAIIIADRKTFSVAGVDVLNGLRRAGIPCVDPFLFPDDVYAESGFVSALDQRLSGTEEIPIAVGSGTINDLTKLSAFRQGRQYLAVATAASMDGYTAYGASITHQGSKQTFDCPAPQTVLADLEVIASAPWPLNPSGYSDLLAKGVAGADWILADALEVEPIDRHAWATVQDFLPDWVGHPQGIPDANPKSLQSLVVGLMMGGFAMQATRSSRPASGAEHQFSHLWDMQHHTHNGSAPSHGFKVGVGTCASLKLYEAILSRDLTTLDVDRTVQQWPEWEDVRARIESCLEIDELIDKGIEETRAKYRNREEIRSQLLRVKEIWPELKKRLENQLRPFRNAGKMLTTAGSPCQPEQIGISRVRLKQSFEQAYYIRRRFTVLDFAVRTGLFHPCLEELFGPGGEWEITPEQGG